MVRRTQAERRAGTIAALIDATIDALAQRGYANTTVREICARAGVSQGALFRHFPSRLAIIERTTAEIGRMHLSAFGAFVGEGGRQPGELLAFTLKAARSVRQQAWHEVMVAARTDPGLRPSVTAALKEFEAAVLGAAGAWFGVTDPDRGQHLGMVLLSVMHALDGEAVTNHIYANPALSAQRLAWFETLIGSELATG